MPSSITWLQLSLHTGGLLVILAFLLLSGGAGAGYWDGALVLYLPLSVFLSIVLSAFAMGKGGGWLRPALVNAGMFFAVILILSLISSKGSLGSYGVLVLFWMLVFTAGVFLISAGAALAVKGVLLAVKGHGLQGLFAAGGVICLFLLLYLSTAEMSQWAYSPLGESERLFFTPVHGESRFTTQYDAQGRPLLCEENGKPYTGIAKAYSSKLKISPIAARVSGLVYFVDGYALGDSYSPEESASLSVYPLTSPSAGLYQQTGLTMPLHKDYQSALEAELRSWGNYLYLPGQSPERNGTALYVDDDQKVHLAEITFHPNGLVSEIRPYLAGEYDEWNSGGGFFLRFDSLGYPLTRQMWLENGTVDYEGEVKVPWDQKDFELCELPSGTLELNASRDQSLETLLLHPRTPELLHASESWDTGLSTYDNLYLLHGGKADFSETTSIGLLVWDDGYGTWTYLNREQGAKVANVLDRAALTTTVENHEETGYGGQSFEFRIGIGEEKSYQLLLKNGHFYLEDGFYTFSLNPYDLPSEEDRYYLNTARDELYSLLHEITGEVIEEFEYVDAESTK